MELINEHEIGVSKGTEVEDAVTGNFNGECKEVGLYLAMARQAQRDGYPEVAEMLKTIAWEEAEHAAQFAEMNGLISKSTKENLEKMLQGEIGANKGKKEAAKRQGSVTAIPLMTSLTSHRETRQDTQGC